MTIKRINLNNIYTKNLLLLLCCCASFSLQASQKQNTNSISICLRYICCLSTRPTINPAQTTNQTNSSFSYPSPQSLPAEESSPRYIIDHQEPLKLNRIASMIASGLDNTSQRVQPFEQTNGMVDEPEDFFMTREEARKLNQQKKSQNKNSTTKI